MKDTDRSGKRVHKALEGLHAKGELTWLPWIGSDYVCGGLMVVGESNYADEDCGPTPEAACRAVDGNVHFTECVVSRFCINRSERNVTFDGVTNVLRKDRAEDILSAGRSAWGRIAYMDVIQQSMCGKGKKWPTVKGRFCPTEEMWVPGWKAVFGVIDILKPGALLFVGAGVAKHFSRKYIPAGYMAEMKDGDKIERHIWRSGYLVYSGGQKIKVCAIPNPGGARGFSPDKWRKRVQKYLGI